MDKIVNEIIQICVCEYRKEKVKRKVEEEIIGPLIDYILEKIKPYILGMSVFLITMILLIICILFLILTTEKTSKIS